MLLHQGFGCEHIKMVEGFVTRLYCNVLCINCCGNSSCENANKFYHERAHLINEVILFLLKFVVSSSKRVRLNMLCCFRDVWRVYAVPYIRIQEITNIFKTGDLTEYCPQHCLEHIIFCCKLYVQELPEIAVGPVTPRSLQHLSRCAIRYSLMNSGFWPNGLKRLRLPTTIEAYLRLLR